MDIQEYLSQVDAAYGSFRGAALEERLRDLGSQCAAEHGEESAAYAALCSELGAYYRGQARYDESIALFQKAAGILAALGREGSPDHTTLLSNMAGTYRLMRRFDEAERLCLLCLERYANTVGRQHVLYAAALNYYAMTKMDMGDTDAAADLLQQSTDVLAALPDCRDEYASSLCNRGALLSAMGRQEEAGALLTEALGLFETELGTDTPHYHAVWNSLGLVRYRQGDLAAAADCFARAADFAQAMYGPTHPETVSARNALETVNRKLEETT